MEILIWGFGFYLGSMVMNGCEVVNGSGDCFVNFF